MPRRPALVLGLALVGCQTAPEPRVVEISMRGDGDGVVLTRTATGCLANGVPITVTADIASGGGWRLAPGPAGLELTEHDALVARIADEAGPPARRAYLDPIGVPLARIAFADDGATVAAADRGPLGTVAIDAGAVVFTPRDGGAVTVSGTSDLTLAVSLVVPATVSISGRAVVACHRLVATSPTPAK